MGNLLNSPITEKATQSGVSPDGSLHFGLSSMQGWRVHMEDAHICLLDIYAEEPRLGVSKSNESSDHSSRTRRSKYMKVSLLQNGYASRHRPSSSSYQRIPLANHSLFAVFDGHGGSFAAEYAGANFFRILSRQASFVQYAQLIQSKPDSGKETLTLNLLQTALRDTFLDLDREILLVERGDLDIDYDSYSTGHDDEQQHTDSFLDEEEEEEDNFEDGDDQDDSTHRNKKVLLHSSSQRLVVKPDEDPGCTALAVMVTPQFIVCANAGDSRSVYSRNGHRAVPLSFDHKPDDEIEKQRIYRAGGTVRAGRVDGDLAVSRGLGDFRFKDTNVVETGTDYFYSLDREESDSLSASSSVSQRSMKIESSNKLKSPEDHMVSSIPDMMVYSREEQQDEFIILACDGIWDVQSNQECVSTVASIFQGGEADMGLLCEEVLDFCLHKGSKDNMTAIVVRFKAQNIGKGGGVEARRQRRLAATGSNNPNHHHPGDY